MKMFWIILVPYVVAALALGLIAIASALRQTDKSRCKPL